MYLAVEPFQWLGGNTSGHARQQSWIGVSPGWGGGIMLGGGGGGKTDREGQGSGKVGLGHGPWQKGWGSLGGSKRIQ
eukprot:768005-Hanusia_phi.AAC.3